MLSLRRCRELLDSECSLADLEVQRIRDSLYEVVEIACDGYGQDALDQADDAPRPISHFTESRSSPSPTRSSWTASSLMGSDVAEMFDERAAIAEFEGGLDRGTAEHLALRETSEGMED